MNKRKLFIKLFLYISFTFIIIPIMILPLWSFFGRWAWPDIFPSGFSLRTVSYIFSSSTNMKVVLFNSFILSISVAIIASIIGLMTARALVLYDFKFKRIISFLSMMPIIVPATAFAMGIHVVFIKLGWANCCFGVLIVHLIYAIPYTINIMIDITSLIGDKLEIQAHVLGVEPYRAFMHVTLPLMIPGILSSMSMAYIISFSQYFLTLLIGGGNVETLSVIMVPFIQSGDRSMASAYSVLFILSIIIAFFIMEFIIKKFIRKFEV